MRADGMETDRQEEPILTSGPRETLEYGRRLARRLKPGDVVALYGNLGAGKTHLIKGICSRFGIEENDVTSPTFTILNEYSGRDFPVYHFDAYRIEDPAEFFELGFQEYFYGEGICLIEWPERVETLLPQYTLRLRLEHQGGDRRLIVGSAPC